MSPPAALIRSISRRDGGGAVHHQVGVGQPAWISAITSMASMSPVGRRVNLYAPWLVPIATASASTPVRWTKSAA